MAYTAAEFEAKARAELAAFPDIAARVQIGDPTVLAQLRANAAMLAMVSAQVDVAQYEPFVKARDATVLADAALKGILPLGRACRVELFVTNNHTAPYNLAAGRRLMDPQGRIFVVDVAVTIPPGAGAVVSCSQKTERTVAFQVAAATTFYRAQVAPAAQDVFINTLDVYRADTRFTYRPDLANVLPDELVYNVETDEQRRLWVCFGKAGVVGYGVQPGDAFEVRLTECEGKLEDLQVGAAFALEYAYTPADGLLALELQTVVDTGAHPHSMAELREMARFPSIYDHDAVYLGEFAFLLRRYHAGVRFLSVWNEQIEEAARGPSVLNINKLFVAGKVDGMDDAVFQARARELIRRADDSYGVVFVPIADTPVAVTVTAKIAVVHDPAAVEAQIRSAILGRYGAGQPAVSRGMGNPIKVQPIATLLRETVLALKDAEADFQVAVELPDPPLPEQFIYVSPESLAVNVQLAQFNNGLWNY